ncbi:MAG TPA: hypothetical protein VKV26_05450 [Dehalococcoidia bacterium]|nr:hypothetical protein [Dehalococcoidia bacterium]
MVTYSGTRKPVQRRQLLAAIALVLAIGTVAGVASWRLGLHAHTSGRATTVAHGQPPSSRQAEPRSAASGSGAAPTGAAAVVPTAQAPQLILVGSVERAQQAQADLDAADVLRIHFGLRPLTAAITPVDTDTSSNLLQAVAELNAVHDMLGLPEIQVIDLRTRPQ